MHPRDAIARIHRANALRRAQRPSGDDERQLAQAFACHHALAVYGTLAPGRENHHVLAPYPGVWSDGTVTGRRAQRAFPVFTFDPAAGPVPVHVLCSEALAAAWPALDDFEGADYRLILVPVFDGGRLHAVANLYEAVVPVD